MKITFIILCTLLVLGFSPAMAQENPGGLGKQMKARGEKLAMFMQGKLFPPQVIVTHQGQLGITEQQRKAIIGAVSETQTKVMEIQWQTQASAQTLAKLLDQDKINETEALKTAGEMFQNENKTKKLHLRLMIKIKNLLTTEQIAKLKTIKAW